MTELSGREMHIGTVLWGELIGKLVTIQFSGNGHRSSTEFGTIQHVSLIRRASPSDNSYMVTVYFRGHRSPFTNEFYAAHAAYIMNYVTIAAAR